MRHRPQSRFRFLKGPYFAAAIAIAAGYHVLDAVVMTSLFQAGEGLWDRLFTPSAEDLWSRLSVAAIMISAGALVQERLYRQREASDSLTEDLTHRGARLQLIIDSVQAGISYVDQQQRFRFVNERYQTLLNVAPDTLVGMTLREAFGEESYAIAEPYVRRALAGESVKFESDRLGLEANLLAYSISYVPDRQSDGTVAGYFAVVYDISNRKETEDAIRATADELDRHVAERTKELEQAMASLRESEARYRSIVNTTNEGFWQIDENMRIVDVNDAICEMLGYTREELLKKRPFDLSVESASPDVKAMIEQDIQGRVEARNWEGELLRKDGALLEVRVAATNFVGQDGELRGRFGFLTDLTEQKQRELELQQAQRLKAVGQLTGGVAHEFNNLLTVILGNIEILDSRLGEDDPLRSFTSSAMKGALRGADLTQGLLAFSRTQKLDATETAINDLIRGMQQLFEQTMGGTITVSTDLAEGLWPTSADAGQVEAALLNFVLNSRDAMPNGGSITIRTANTPLTDDQVPQDDGVEPGDYVTLEVSDSGTGMTQEQLERAFEPFYTTKSVGSGTGLGLSVAYGFAKQSGGDLKIASELGRGTTTRLSLPRASTGTTTHKNEPSAAVPVAGSGTILVVEDDLEVRRLVCNQLTQLGYRVHEADDGAAALVLLDEHRDIDLLFSDMVLPGGMSGPEAAARALSHHPDLNLLFTSGYPDPGNKSPGMKSTDWPILAKPYRKSELAEAVAAAMKSD